MVTSLLWPMSFGPLVTVLTGFHCMMFFTLECIGFNNILAHTWALFIPHLSAVSNLSNHIILVSWMGGIKAKSIGSPAYFSPPRTAQLVFVLPCSTWEPVCRPVVFFFFKQLVTVLSVSYTHFRGICVKTERADYYCTYMYCILKSETVVICCSMYLLPLVPQWFHSHQFSASWPLVPHLIWYFSFRLL